MSQQQNALTYEVILELFQETARKFQETDRKFKETDRKFKETDLKFQETDRRFQETDRKFQEAAEQLKKTQREVGKLGSRIGDIVENMVSGNIVEKFKALGYDVRYCAPMPFHNKKLGIAGEIDLFLDDGDAAILIEVKTTLEMADVRKHMERIEKYRRYTQATSGDKRSFIGAIAGAVVTDEALINAHENGMYVIVQSGKAVEILTPPEGFTARQW